MIESDPDGDLVYYILLRASSLFHIEHNRYPGVDGYESLESDIASLKKHVNILLNEYGITFTIKDDFIIEM